MKYRLYRAAPEHRGLRRYIWTWREWLQLLSLFACAMAMAWLLQPIAVQIWVDVLPVA